MPFSLLWQVHMTLSSFGALCCCLTYEDVFSLSEGGVLTIFPSRRLLPLTNATPNFFSLLLSLPPANSCSYPAFTQFLLHLFLHTAWRMSDFSPFFFSFVHITDCLLLSLNPTASVLISFSFCSNSYVCFPSVSLCFSFFFDPLCLTASLHPTSCVGLHLVVFLPPPLLASMPV